MYAVSDVLGAILLVLARLSRRHAVAVALLAVLSSGVVRKRRGIEVGRLPRVDFEHVARRDGYVPV